MARRALVEILGDSSSLQKSLRDSAVATEALGGDMKRLAVNAQASARAQVEASIKKDAALRESARAFRAEANAAEHGSQRQVVAANLAVQAEKRLARSMGVSAAEAKRLSAGLGRAGRDTTGFGRGILAGSGALGHFGRAAIFASNSVLGGVGVAYALRQIIGQASTLQEETEKTGVVFGRSAGEIQRWAGTLATSFGVGEGEALKAAGVFGNMFHSLHVGQSDAATMSKRLVELAADMASFNNASPEDTLAALQSGLAGQARPLRQFGVFLSQARINAEAYGDGIAKAGSKLNANQKLLATYNIILKDTAIQQGDVARNTGSLSVSQSKLHAALEDSEAIIGRQLLPSLVSLSNEAARYLTHLNETGDLQRQVASTARDLRDAIKGVRAVLAPVVSGLRILGKISGGTENEVKLLGTAFLLLRARSALVKWGLIAAGETAVGSAAGGAATKVGLLEGALARLKGLGPIAVAVGITEFLQFAHNQSKNIATQNGPNFTLKGSNRQFSLGGRGGVFGSGQSSLMPGVAGVPLNPFTPNIFGSGNLGLGALRPVFPRFPFTGKDSATARGLSLQGRFNLLELRKANAEQTNNQRLVRAILVSEEGILKAQESSAKKLKDRTQIAQQLAGVMGEIRGIDQSSAEAAKQAAQAAKQRRVEERKRVQEMVQARQFRALGLDATGQPLTPGVRALRRELGTVSQAIEGTFLDTKKERSVLSRIRRVLSGGLGDVTKDVRAQVKSMLDDIDQQLKDHAGQQTKFQKANSRLFFAGLGLDPDQLRAARARLSQLGAGGTVPGHGVGAFGYAVPVGASTIEVHHTTTLDGRAIEQSVTRHQQKRQRRNPAQRRGPNAAWSQ